MKRYKHWTYFLPEPGAIGKRGEAQFRLLDEMDSLQEKLEQLRNRWEIEEEELNKLCSTSWTPEEIESAKLNAKRNWKQLLIKHK